MSFFNETATTEIYTYRPTRARHDALPIFRRVTTRCVTPVTLRERTSTPSIRGQGSICPEGTSRIEVSAAAAGVLTERSEEPTSELQSIMRISYAVFCLKKYNNPIKPTY